MKHADMPSGDMETGSLVHKQDYDACEEDTKYFSPPCVAGSNSELLSLRSRPIVPAFTSRWQ